MTGAARDASTASTSVVVVAHDSGELLLRCVDSVLAQDTPVELIVVDNASRDGSLARLPRDARVRLQRNDDNRGFAVACNQGAALARGDTLLFLNPDCVLAPDTIARLLAHLRAAPHVGVLGAQLLNDDGSPQAAARRRTPTPLHALRLALGLASRDAAVPPPAASASATRAGLESVDAVSGALMLVPRATFDALGGFDPGYVLHCEDLDLCRRVLASGAAVALAADVEVVHAKGTSSRRRPVWVEWQKHRGMLRYFGKFDAAASPPWLRVAVPLGVWLRFPLAAARAWWRARQR